MMYIYLLISCKNNENNYILQIKGGKNLEVTLPTYRMVPLQLLDVLIVLGIVFA